MQCIAEAAGTEYRDAFSAEELIAGLGAVVEVAAPSEPLDAGEPDPQPQVAEAAVRLDVVTPDGVARRGWAACDRTNLDFNPLVHNRRILHHQRN